MEPTRTAEQTETLVAHILMNSEKVTQSGVIEMGLSDHELLTVHKKHHFWN